jgi:hypothetical protein
MLSGCRASEGGRARLSSLNVRTQAVQHGHALRLCGALRHTREASADNGAGGGAGSGAGEGGGGGGHSEAAMQAREPEAGGGIAEGALPQARRGGGRVGGEGGAAAQAGTRLGALAAVTHALWGVGFASACPHSTTCLRAEGEQLSTARAWLWQQCSQIGQFPVAAPPRPDGAESRGDARAPGGVRHATGGASFFMGRCVATFGKGTRPDVYRAARAFARHGNWANVVVTAGARDPWRRAALSDATAGDRPLEFLIEARAPPRPASPYPAAMGRVGPARAPAPPRAGPTPAGAACGRRAYGEARRSRRILPGSALSFCTRVARGCWAGWRARARACSPRLRSGSRTTCRAARG